MEVWFYHLQRQTLREVLPVLAGKALERGWRVAVQGVDEARLKALDDWLWSFKPDSFLPHAMAGDPRAARQPLLLTGAAEDGGDAELRIYVEGAEIADEVGQAGYQRVMLLFDGNDGGELAAARAQWSRLKKAGLALAYWQQDEAGRWDRKAG